MNKLCLNQEVVTNISLIFEWQIAIRYHHAQTRHIDDLSTVSFIRHSELRGHVDMDGGGPGLSFLISFPPSLISHRIYVVVKQHEGRRLYDKSE